MGFGEDNGVDVRLWDNDEELVLPKEGEDVAGLKDDVADLKVSVRRIDFRTQNQTDAVFADMNDLKKRVTVLEKRPV
ncbi:MAG: hypothetical protein WAT84_00155 [Candidatus Moraniibacteriota bacterium]